MAQKPHSLEHTAILSSRQVFHYTCNPPDQKILDRYRIKAIGDQFGCKDPREVLLIPERVYKSHGLPVRDTDIQAVSEVLLRKLGYEKK
jgi:hypothetical protein